MDKDNAAADASPLQVFTLAGSPISFERHGANLLGDVRKGLAEAWNVGCHNVQLVSGGEVLCEDERRLDTLNGVVTAVRLSRVEWAMEPFAFEAGYEVAWSSANAGKDFAERCQHPDKEFAEWCLLESEKLTWGAFTRVTAIPRDVQPWEDFRAQEAYVDEYELAGNAGDLGSTRPIDVLLSLVFWYLGGVPCRFGVLCPPDDTAAVGATYLKSAKEGIIHPSVAEEAEKSFKMIQQLVEKRGTVGEVFIPDALEPITHSVGLGHNDDDRFACFATAKYNFYMKFVHPG